VAHRIVIMTDLGTKRERNIAPSIMKAYLELLSAMSILKHQSIHYNLRDDVLYY
jgi:hypothetical protein